MTSTAPTTNLETPNRVMVIPAHPDDAEFGAGGTIAKWARAGAKVSYLVISDGSKGSWDPDEVPGRLAAKREEEQQRACALLGASQPEFLGLIDGTIEATMDLRREIAGYIRRNAPEIVITHDPWKRYMLHPDHRAVGTAACDAVVAARDPHYFPDQIEPGSRPPRPRNIMLWSADEADHVEELSESDVETKLLGLRAHESQFESTMGHTGVSTQESRAFDEKIRARCRNAGSTTGFAYGEAFKLLDANR